uniref:Uncharacterized protein n=1 Tax=Arundo donax TaxID=35708 RepID=A0A0A9DEI7_ARUDO
MQSPDLFTRGPSGSTSPPATGSRRHPKQVTRLPLSHRRARKPPPPLQIPTRRRSPSAITTEGAC